MPETTKPTLLAGTEFLIVILFRYGKDPRPRRVVYRPASRQLSDAEVQGTDQLGEPVWRCDGVKVVADLLHEAFHCFVTGALVPQTTRTESRSIVDLGVIGGER